MEPLGQPYFRFVCHLFMTTEAGEGEPADRNRADLTDGRLGFEGRPARPPFVWAGSSSGVAHLPSAAGVTPLGIDGSR